MKTTERLESRCLLAAGDLDASFGVGGVSRDDRASQGADDEPAHTGRPITPPASARSGQRTEATD